MRGSRHCGRLNPAGVFPQVGGLPRFSGSHSVSQQEALSWLHIVLMSRNIKLRFTVDTLHETEEGAVRWQGLELRQRLGRQGLRWQSPKVGC